MKEFLRVAFDPNRCRQDLAAFRDLLAARQELEEAADIKPCQIVDWFCKLDDMARTDEFEARFGARAIQYFGLLVIGRDAHLSHPRERRRWEWRSQKVLVNSLPVLSLTYDQLYRLLFDKLNLYSPPAVSPTATGS